MHLEKSWSCKLKTLLRKEHIRDTLVFKLQPVKNNHITHNLIYIKV